MEQKNKTRLIAVAFYYDGKKIGYLSTDYSITENINNAYISDFEDLTNIVKKIKDVFFSFSEYMLSVSFFDKNLNVYYTGEFKNLTDARNEFFKLSKIGDNYKVNNYVLK